MDQCVPGNELPVERHWTCHYFPKFVDLDWLESIWLKIISILQTDRANWLINMKQTLWYKIPYYFSYTKLNWTELDLDWLESIWLKIISILQTERANWLINMKQTTLWYKIPFNVKF